PEMHREISRWLNEFKCKPEYLIIMLELCFERNIYDPREITAIARGLHEYAVGNLSGMEQYFRSVVDKPGHFPSRKHEFALEMMEFGSYTGIDMQAEARRKTYEKWRYEWRFSHEMIMKAGEIMCQRTKSGGMEYVERVLANWLAKGISTVAEAEQDTSEFKKRSQRAGSRLNILNRSSGDKAGMEIFVAPHVLEELKTKA
ncbi:MAG: DnaD domain protein, partial [Syntrophomonadaceae bacterium]|nr:DnaD domain protein [Syntrophomonadaceae bacterium]